MTVAISHKGIGHLVTAIEETDTTMILSPGDAQAFTNVNGDSNYALLRGPIDRELVKIDVSASQSENGILTIARGQGGTSAEDWPAGTLVLASTHADFYNSLLQSGKVRTIDYNPNEVLNPLYSGEKVYQSGPAGCERWWKSFNAVNPYWDIITGNPCGEPEEEYVDIGWDYDILISKIPDLAAWVELFDFYAVDTSATRINSIAYDTKYSVLATAVEERCWNSADQGDNWTYRANAGYRMVDIEYDPDNDALISCGQHVVTPVLKYNGVWRSADGGVTWGTPILLIDDSDESRFLVYDPANQIMCAIVEGFGTIRMRSFYSSDGGLNWNAGGTLSILTEPMGVVYDPDNSAIVLLMGDNVGTTHGAKIYTSTDGGINWTLKCDLRTEYDIEYVITIAYDSSFRNRLVLSARGVDPQYETASIWASSDGGETWTIQYYPIGDLDEWASMAYNPIADRLYGVKMNSSDELVVDISADGGETWYREKTIDPIAYAFGLGKIKYIPSLQKTFLVAFDYNEATKVWSSTGIP